MKSAENDGAGREVSRERERELNNFVEMWHLQFERDFGWIDNKLKDECKIFQQSQDILQYFDSHSSAVVSKFAVCLLFNLSGFLYSFTRGPLIYFTPTGKTIESRPSAINILLIIILIAFQINTATARVEHK